MDKKISYVLLIDASLCVFVYVCERVCVYARVCVCMIVRVDCNRLSS